jgi:hypothetical protein
MNILFVSNGALTPVYSNVAKHLQSRGHKIFWIVTERVWLKFLLKDFNKRSILHLNKNSIDKLHNTPNIKIPLNEIIFIDREIKTWGSDKYLKYIQNLHHQLKNFLISNEINFAFSENTWAHEIIISMICDVDNEVNCIHLSPHNIRIPDNKFAFFSDFLLHKPFIHNGPFDEIKESCLKQNKQIIAQDDVIVSRRKSKIHWIRKLISFVARNNYDNDSPTLWGTRRYNSLKRNLSDLLKGFTYKFVNKLDEAAIAELAKTHELYVYAFHKEPETAINNKGRYNESQATNIINIWRKLPLGCVLLIKEHRVSIGDRGYFYFQKLLKLGSIKVINESIKSSFVMEKCSVCFTVSGTMAYEFAINQKPALTFAKVFFNDLKYCSHLSTTELTKGDDMNALIKRLILGKEGLNNKQYVEQLSSQCFSGTIDDTNNLPEVMNSSNIALLCSAFERVVEQS